MLRIMGNLSCVVAHRAFKEGMYRTLLWNQWRVCPFLLGWKENV